MARNNDDRLLDHVECLLGWREKQCNEADWHQVILYCSLQPCDHGVGHGDRLDTSHWLSSPNSSSVNILSECN